MQIGTAKTSDFAGANIGCLLTEQAAKVLA
jgi:hypothetical protein